MSQVATAIRIDDSAISATVRDGCLKAYNDRAVASALTSPMGTLLLAWIEWNTVGPLRAVAWLVAINLTELLMIGLGHRFRQATDRGDSASAWQGRLVLSAGLTGLAWGSSVWFFQAEGQYFHYLLNMSLLVAVSAICVFVMSPLRLAMLAFTSGILLPPLLHAAIVPNEHRIEIVIGLLVLFVLVLQYAFLSERQLRDSLANAARNAVLVDQLALRTRALEASQAQLSELNAELEQRITLRTGELQSINRELEMFSYAVSHDLRGPLRAVSGFSSLLRSEEGARLSDTAQLYLATIESNGHKMGALIDALLALGRYAHVELGRDPVDIRALVQECWQDVSGKAPDACLALGELPAATGHATLLKQVFLNLLDNALKYTRDSSPPRIEVGADAGVYCVSDNGTGFDMGHASKLFKPFERLHTTGDFEGTGVGLAIVKVIIDRHGGRIWADSSPGAGARFFFTLGDAA
jgi:signal transduction histidine kinase